MPIDWKDPETKDRLLAAIIASFPGSINCREVARLFGPEATYNAIENFLRGPKKQALKLKEQAGTATSTSPPRGKKGTAAKAVLSGRVQKSPTKKKVPECNVKLESMDEFFGTDGDDEV